MDQLLKSKGYLGRFGVVKLWPKLKTAEDECIERLKIAAQKIGVECVVVDKAGHLLGSPSSYVNKENVDFVIHLHFETPKVYDAFSFVALWNPLQFYFEWGYRRFSNNLLSHDDFLSCSSPWADDHARRLMGSDPFRSSEEFLTLYHSVADPIYEPGLGERKIMYTGINWERISGKEGRFHLLLKTLEHDGVLRIHGPDVFQGVSVWKGFSSYAGPIPFDGRSIIDSLKKSGIGLVLSSEAHKQSGLMSSRLFETVAAGAAVICDENPFAKKHFGDSLFYIDSWRSPMEIRDQILAHYNWIITHEKETLQKIAKSQAIFKEHFLLDKSLEKIYLTLGERKEKLQRLRYPTGPQKRVHLISILDQELKKSFEVQLENALSQDYVDIKHVFLSDDNYQKDVKEGLIEVWTKLKGENGKSFPVVLFAQGSGEGSPHIRIPLGTVLEEYIKTISEGEMVCVVGPNERLLSDHISSLVGALQRFPDNSFALSDNFLHHRKNGESFFDYDMRFDPLLAATESCGRFLFRVGPNLSHSFSTLRYLKYRFPLVLIGKDIPSQVALTRRATIIQNIQHYFHYDRHHAGMFESELAMDFHEGYRRETFEFLKTGINRFSLAEYANNFRLDILRDLIKAIPFPRPFFLFFRAIYRHMKKVVLAQSLKSKP